MKANRLGRTTRFALFMVPALAFAGPLICSARTFGADVCLPLYKNQTVDRTGLVFSVEETDCDSLAKEIYAEVFVSASVGGKRDVLFKYDPLDQVRPSIEVDHARGITISVDRVSQIFFEAHVWHGIAIQYHIGRVLYPSPFQGDEVKPKAGKL